MSGLHQLSATEQIRAMRAGDLSSRELTEHYLERISRLDGEIGAVVTVTPEVALEEAARADERRTHGESAPLLGLPLGFKDLFPAAGAPTRLGSAATPRSVSSSDAWTVGLLRRAGSVIIGKTTTSEFGATCFAYNEETSRPAVTPYDRTRYASGSSAGAAAAVAAGLLPAAHASDGAGSTRTPAATCHLVGVKPSRGLVSPSVPLASLSSTTIEGPITRTVEDAALLLEVMAHPWSGDPYSWHPEQSFATAVERGPERPVRVAAWTATGIDGIEAHPEAVLAVERTAKVLDELGHNVELVPIPAGCDEPVRQALRSWFAASVTATVASLVPTERLDLLLPYTRYLYDQGELLSGHDTLAAHGVLARYASAYLAALDEFDVALTPTTSGPPVRVGHFSARGVADVADLMLAWSCFTPWANFTGQPAVSLPSHLDCDGLPYGVQIVGRPRHDAELLALAAQLEDAAMWDDVHPPGWDQ